MLLLLIILLFIKYEWINVIFKNSNLFKITKVFNISIIKFNFYLDKNNNEFILENEFLEWFVGFTDAEGNFIITLRDNPRFKVNTLLNSNINIIPKYINLTFQICLHKNDLKTLQYIQKKLKCGRISISNNKCNYYVSDFHSIIYIIIPLFNSL